MTAKPKAKSKTAAAPEWPATKPEMRPLSRILPYPNNPRTHPPAQIAMLADLMKANGVDQPIVVDEDGVILKGHGRRLAAMLAGFDEFPVVVHRGLSEEAKKAMRLADNQVALLSGWDTELVRGEIASLKTSGYDVGLLGFGEQQLVSFMTTPGPPGSFPTFGEDIDTKYCCPRCGYSWSGKPKSDDEEDDSVRLRMQGETSSGGRSRPASKVPRGAPLARASKTGKSKTRKHQSSNGPDQGTKTP